jgi:hypothetical protein
MLSKYKKSRAKVLRKHPRRAANTKPNVKQVKKKKETKLIAAKPRRAGLEAMVVPSWWPAMGPRPHPLNSIVCAQ